MAEESFADLMVRVRSGDADAAALLVRRYEPEIRREVRFLLRDPFLRRSFDSMDICQSVMSSFFVRASLGEYDLNRPEDLIRLLISMTRNKVVDATRRQRAQRRDHRRATSLEAVDVAAQTPSPSQVAEGRELLAAFRGKLSDDERRLADLRANGREWADIAGEVGGTAEARRKQLTRAIARVSRELGL
ncbi:MAG: sigma-70 family RNA polymerase sigma factor, partial [Gemmataceae bacterium]|nr:sigma-70 family RNA polymerase sigma factor [Gemmataceae bacterium]